MASNCTTTTNNTVPLKQLLYGTYEPPVAVSVRKHSIMHEPEPPQEATDRKSRDCSRNRQRLLAMGLATKERIKAAIPAVAGRSMDEVVEHIGMSKSVVQKHLLALLDEGHVKRRKLPRPTGGYMFVYYPVQEKQCPKHSTFGG